MIEGTRQTCEVLAPGEDVFKKVKLTADAGFHTKKNMEMVFSEGIDAYIADRQFRKRDTRFSDRDRYKVRARKERRSSWFTPRDFIFDMEHETCICPAGKHLYVKNRNFSIRGYKAIAFMGKKTECRVCKLRKRCLKYPDRTEARQVHFFYGKSSRAGSAFIEKMKQKIDSALGRLVYSKRIGTVEPVFAHITSVLGLDRFTLRGKRKVNTQWLLYCIVHNIHKIHRFAPGFT